VGQRFDPSPTNAETAFVAGDGDQTRDGVVLIPSPCTVGRLRTTDDRTPRSAAGIGSPKHDRRPQRDRDREAVRHLASVKGRKHQLGRKLVLVNQAAEHVTPADAGTSPDAVSAGHPPSVNDPGRAS